VLLEYSITTLIDIRSLPKSTQNPHFDEEPLRASMQQCQIDYHWAGRQLGGKRDIQTRSNHVSLTMEQQAFADYMDDAEFKRAVTQLISFATRTQLVIMGSNESTDNCYRLMIADYLLLNGIEVQHIEPIIADNIKMTISLRGHELDSMARLESSNLIYDRQLVKK